MVGRCAEIEIPGLSTGVRVLLLDVGGVIVPPASAALAMDLEDQLGLARGQLSPFLFEQEPWYALSTGRITSQEYWERLANQISWNRETLQRMLQPIHSPAQVDRHVMEIARGVRSTLRLAILSNATLGLEEHLRELGVAHLFDPIINSARVGLRKPDPRLFAHAVCVLGVPAESILFVDDKARNTLAAEQCGIPSITFENATQLAEVLARRGMYPLRTTP